MNTAAEPQIGLRVSAVYFSEPRRRFRRAYRASGECGCGLRTVDNPIQDMRYILS